MLIRAARMDDLERIGELWLELALYHTTLDEALPRPSLDGPMRYINHLALRLDDWDYTAFVAEAEGQVVGYVTAMLVEMMPDTFEGERGGMIGDIYVMPTYRGGTGRALMRAAQDWFRLRRVQYYEWYVASANVDGLAFWKAMGGREIMHRLRAKIEDVP